MEDFIPSFYGRTLSGVYLHLGINDRSVRFPSQRMKKTPGSKARQKNHSGRGKPHEASAEPAKTYDKRNHSIKRDHGG
jgi:hypothetical protein